MDKDTISRNLNFEKTIGSESWASLMHAAIGDKYRGYSAMYRGYRLCPCCFFRYLTLETFLKTYRPKVRFLLILLTDKWINRRVGRQRSRRYKKYAKGTLSRLAGVELRVYSFRFKYALGLQRLID